MTTNQLEKVLSASASNSDVCGWSTTSPIFYSIPPSSFDYSVFGLGPGQISSSGASYRHFVHLAATTDNGEGKSTIFNDIESPYIFLSEYKKEFNRGTLDYARPNVSPWWKGRERTSKINIKFPFHPKYMENTTTYKSDFAGVGHKLKSEPADLRQLEREVAQARKGK